MQLLSILIITLLILIFSWVFLNGRRKSKVKLPKGPRGLPFLGNLLQIVKNTHLQLSSWAYEFGNLYTIKLGPANAVVIADPHYAREILSDAVTAGKFKNDTFLLLSQGNYGILKTEGKVWAEQRRFCVQTLKRFGFDGNSLEPMVLSQADCLVEWINRETAKDDLRSVVLKDILRLVTINCLWTIIAGKTLPLEYSELSNCVEEVFTAFQETIKTGLGFFPWLKYIAPKKSGYVGLDKACKKLHSFMQKYFTNDDNKSDEPNDLISAYVQHMKTTTDSESSFYGPEGEKHSIAIAVELFLAGSETIATTINWVIFYLCVELDVQKKMIKEIDEVLGKSVEPTIADRTKMPYTEAVILETLRYAAMVPHGTINQLLEDFEYKEYYMPKGTLLICPMYHIHHNRKIWKDPQVFRPERFLENGSTELKNHVIPFLVGRRTCIADSLSRDILFLFVTKIFQNFHVERHPKISKDEYFQPDVGQLLLTQKHKVVIRNR